jgi:hypothetical protein
MYEEGYSANSQYKQRVTLLILNFRRVIGKKIQAGLRIRIHLIRIRIQHFRLDTDPDPDPIRIQGFKKKPSDLKREYPTLQNMKFLNFFYFCGSFLPSWIRIRIPNPDSLTRLNPGPIGIRIRNPADMSQNY